MVPSTLTIGEVSFRSGIAVSALRFYEEKGLISAQRTPGGQRRYSRAVLRRLGVLRAAQSLGLSLAEIRDAFARLPGDRAPGDADWQALARQWDEKLEKRIEALQLLRTKLTACIQCGCLSLGECPLRNPDDVGAAKGAGAHWLQPLAQ